MDCRVPSEQSFIKFAKMILKKFWGVDKKLPNIHLDESDKHLEGKKLLMMKVAKRKKAAGVLQSFATYMLSTILFIFLMFLLFEAIFDVNLCVSCLASYPEIIKHKMNKEEYVIPDYEHNIINDMPDNSSNLETMTTKSSVSDAETTLAINLKEQSEKLGKLETDRERINFSEDMLPEKIAAYQNHESVTNSLKNNKGDMISNNEHTLIKVLPKNSSNLGIITTESAVTNGGTTLAINLKKQSENLGNLEMDLKQVELLKGTSAEEMVAYDNHESMTNSLKNPDPDSISEDEIKSSVNINKHVLKDKNISKELSKNFRDMGVMTTSGFVTNTETLSSDESKAESKEPDPLTLKMDPILILLFQAMLYNEMTDQNHESIKKTMMNNMRNAYQNQDSSVNIDTHVSKDKNISKELSENFRDMGVMTTSGLVPNTETLSSDESKEESKELDPLTLKMDPILILLFQAMLYNEMTDQNHESIKKTMMNNMHSAYQNQDNVSRPKIPMRNSFSIHEHNSKPHILADMHHNIRNTSFKYKTFFLQSSQTVKNNDKDTDILNTNKIFPNSEDEMDVFMEHYTLPKERDDEKKSPVLIGKLSHELQDLKSNLQNLPLSNTESKTIMSILPNLKKIEESYKTTSEQDINENKFYSEETESALNDSIIHPSSFSRDVLSPHIFMRLKFKKGLNKLSSLKKAATVKDKQEVFPSKYFTEIAHDRSYSKAKFDKQILKVKKKIEINDIELTSPSSSIFLNESNISFEIDANAANNFSNHTIKHLFASKDSITTENIKNRNHLNVHNGRKMENKKSDMEVLNLPVVKSLKNLPSISIVENKYSRSNETLLSDTTKIHNFNELLQRNESVRIANASKEHFPLREYYNEEQFETDKLLPKSSRKSKIRLFTKSQTNRFPIDFINQKALNLQKENGTYDLFEESTKSKLKANEKNYPIMKLSITESVHANTVPSEEPVP